MKKALFFALVEKYVSGECTAEETALLDDWYKSFDEQPEIFESLPAEEVEQLRLQLFAGIRNKIENRDAASRNKDDVNKTGR